MEKTEEQDGKRSITTQKLRSKVPIAAFRKSTVKKKQAKQRRLAMEACGDWDEEAKYSD